MNDSPVQHLIIYSWLICAVLSGIALTNKEYRMSLAFASAVVGISIIGHFVLI